MDEKKKSELNYREKDGVIYFDLVRNGMTAEEWLDYFEANNVPVHGYFKYCLRSKFFVPGESGTIIKVAITRKDRSGATTEQVREEAANLSLVETSMETACLLQMNFSAEDLRSLGLERIAVMHKPISYPVEGFELFLGIRADHVFVCNYYIESPKFNWGYKTGHAFELP